MKKEDKEDFFPIKQALEKYWKAMGKEQVYTSSMVINAWDEVIGYSIKNHVDKVYFENGRLFVMLKSAVLRADLSMDKSRLLQKINEKLGEKAISEIVLV